jgi:hypothetical protein
MSIYTDVDGCWIVGVTKGFGNISIGISRIKCGKENESWHLLKENASRIQLSKKRK